MHAFGDRPRLVLHEEDVCKNKAHVRLYCLAKDGSGGDLMAIYRQAQILFREFEIAALKMQPWPTWYQMFLDHQKPWATEETDDLPF
jgi:hypothetical protein